MKVFHARTEGKPSELRSETFSGTVWADPIMPATDGVTINNVFFAPGGRTHWHSHERGPDAFRALLEKDSARVAALVKAIGLKPEN